MIVTTLPHVTTYFNPRTPRGVRLADKYTAMSKYTSISIHAPREGCDSKLYQRAESCSAQFAYLHKGKKAEHTKTNAPMLH